MPKYEVKEVLFDYGLYRYGELKFILNSKRIALQILKLLQEDDLLDRELNMKVSK